MLDAKTRLMLALSTTMVVSAAMNLEDSAEDTSEDGEENDDERHGLAVKGAEHSGAKHSRALVWPNDKGWRREERRHHREQQKMHSNKNAPRR